MAAGRSIARGFAQAQPDFALEPKALFIDEDDKCNGHSANVRREFGKVIEDGLGQRVEDVISFERRQSHGVVRGYDGSHSGFLQPIGDLM